MSYTPQVDDYVKWEQKHFVDEGWIYFKCQDDITIEVGTKDKPDSLVDLHKKTHILVVCQSEFWNDLEYIKNRRNSEDEYKSQEHRYRDP